ncbi:GNAT family N-acetyltransferase [Pseudomonas protegens]|uniref:GNAT family N-acetyltransferase n=1 Tax=Pseudomonas protegens TaxID=380021 RepID=UPI001B33FAB1|nr:GNAT family N-acetyltransferase [Pseudomonas protegens]MBP5106061.1 GNAT family N-acetyltransferase [Pseudomonas protegens]MBP5129974.1 GNAT family N-acetyltransferase [Pseudomonas protegens]MBP5147412.1 GNAT family N-acetyltransferase [Pseudomonas protegens]QEN47468.1 GNAT family N-acetyltransferase [Pseudomonas protegens]
MNTRIDMLMNPGPEVRAAILEPLRAHNRAQAGDPKPEAIALVVRDEHSGEILGGLQAEIFYRWMFIELLAVPEQTRGQGTGSQLLNMAEELAREKGCIGIWLDTFDFQAPQFYQRHGFSEFGRLEEFPPQHRRFFLHKRLV